MVSGLSLFWTILPMNPISNKAPGALCSASLGKIRHSEKRIQESWFSFGFQSLSRLFLWSLSWLALFSKSIRSDLSPLWVLLHPLQVSQPPVDASAAILGCKDLRGQSLSLTTQLLQLTVGIFWQNTSGHSETVLHLDHNISCRWR